MTVNTVIRQFKKKYACNKINTQIATQLICSFCNRRFLCVFFNILLFSITELSEGQREGEGETYILYLQTEASTLLREGDTKQRFLGGKCVEMNVNKRIHPVSNHYASTYTRNRIDLLKE